MNAAPSPVEASLTKVRAGYLPPTTLKVSQFSDRELVVTSGPLAGTRWRTDFAPYQRGILDVFHEPGVQYAVVMGSSQWGKTATAVNIVGYHMAHDPCPILVVEPTVEPMAKDFAKNRLDPLIAASPVLAEAVARKRSTAFGPQTTNTTLQKTFRGGALAIGGANSAASLASRSVRLLILDEIDRYKAQLAGEGNTLSIALKRTNAYRRRRRVMMLSSPTFANGPIHSWYLRGDQRKYFVPCPACGHMHTFEWANVKWDNHDPNTARLECPACQAAINDGHRLAILSRGEWRPTWQLRRDPENPTAPPERGDPAIVSFHLWEAYSPLSSLAEIVRSFLRARQKQKEGDGSEMHTWENTTLGEPVEPDAGTQLESHVLLLRREPVDDRFDLAPLCVGLTMGVDTQDDRLEALVVGWGPGEESWLVDRITLPGDTSQPEPWAMLDELLDHQYAHPADVKLPISAICIDSAGHRTTMVYDYAAKMAARRVFAIIGRDGERPLVSSPSPRKWGRQQRKVPLYTIGVDAAKALLVSRMGLTEKGRGYVHLPLTDWADDELAAQLTSEKLVQKFSRGVAISFWKKTRPRNEALDCLVYALAALRLWRPDLEALAKKYAAKQPPTLPSTPAPRARFLGPRRAGWLRNR